MTQEKQERRGILLELLQEKQRAYSSQLETFELIANDLISRANESDGSDENRSSFIDRLRREQKRFEARLPMFGHRAVILQKLAAEQVMLLIGQTGSGKSTQLCQYIAEEDTSGTPP